MGSKFKAVGGVLMSIFTKFSLKNIVVIFLIIIMIIGGGIYSTGNIKQEAMPNINLPIITTTTLYIGAAPEDVAEKISRPMQKAISGIQGVDSVQTISKENVSIVVTTFSYSKNMDTAQKDIQDAANKVVLPDNAQRPVVSKISMGGFPIMTYSIDSSMDINDLTQFIDNKVKPKLDGVQGVSNIEVQGTSDKKIYIKLDNVKLNANNLTSQDIQNTLLANNVSIPAGQINIDDKSMTIKISSKILSLNDLKAIPFIVLPNQTKLISESMGKITSGISELGLATQKLGEAVAAEGQGMQQLGALTGSNTRAIAMLNIIQKTEAMILSQTAVLSNPASTQAEKVKAGMAIEQGQAMLKGAQQGLDTLLNSLENNKGTAVKAKGPANTANTTKTAPKADKTSTKIAIKTVFLKDIASVTMGEAEQTFYTRADLKRGIIINVYKNDDANTVGVASDIKTALDELSKTNKNVTFNRIEDSSDIVKSSVEGMVKEGLLGAFFAVLIIALFLRDIRATVIAVISIPLSILIALILFPVLNITINTVTLAGITVAIGRIVDDSIVVIENIFRRINEGDADRENLIENATKEVSSAITSSTITTIAVFLPLGFVSGIIGKFFVPFAITVVICMIASLLVAITVVPVMCKLMLQNRPAHKHRPSRVVNIYNTVLKKALRHKLVVIIGSLALLGVSLFMVSRVPIQFMPADTTSVLEAKLNLAPGTASSKTNEEALKFEKYLAGDPNVKNVVSSVGDNTGSGSGMSYNIQASNEASFIIVLKDGIDYSMAAKEITLKAKEFNKVDESIAVRTVSSTGQKDNFSLIVKGDNMKSIEKAATRITKELETTPEFMNLSNNLAEKKKEISVQIDNDKAANKGLTPLMVAGIVRGMMVDNTIMTIKDGGKDVDVVMGFKNMDINSLDKVKNIAVKISGISFKLKDVANIEENYGPVSISELDGNQYATITADISGNDTQTISTNAKAKVDAIKDQLPKDITYSLGGSSKMINDGFSQMGMAMAVAVLLVYVVMVLAFGEATAPFAILFSLPFAAVGAIFALFITKQALTMPALIGMLMLIGIVVTNAIVLLDRVQSNRKKGMIITEALLEAGSIRLRPIFMTAIATVMALTPLALGFSKGTILSQGLGIVVIGGLTLSTLLTLIIVPVIYASLETFKEKRMKKA
jgi:multidrug efflux pump subunit AcrB